jgi:hypothetical protein
MMILFANCLLPVAAAAMMVSFVSLRQQLQARADAIM